MTPTLRRLVPPASSSNPAADALRGQVRAFLAEQLAAGAFTPSVDAWLCGWDETFTRSLARQG